MSESRTLVNFQKLPEGRFLDSESVGRDIEDAIRKAEVRLQNMAQRYGVTGWEIDTTYGREGYDYGLVNHTIVGRLRLVRS